MSESSTGSPGRRATWLAGALTEHDPLVRWVVGRSQLWGLPFEDAVHEGRIGLWRALRGYDPARGTAFSTYAVPAIQRAVWAAVAGHRSASTASPSPDYAAPVNALRGLGLVSSDESTAILDGLHAALVRAELGRLIAQLPPRQQQIIVAHYGLDGQAPQTFAAIGRLLGVSRQRVQQLQVAAVVSLAQPSRSLALRLLCGRNQRTDYQRALARQHRVARARRSGRRGRP